MGDRQTYYSSCRNAFRITNASIIYITFLSLFLLCGCTNAFDPYGEPPLIVQPAEAEITVLPTENREFICQGSEPITWRLKDPEINKIPGEIEDELIQNDERPYQSTLKLKNIDYMYVGYFYCVKIASPKDADIEELLQLNQAAKVYLFVDDPHHPVVEINYPFVAGRQYEDVVIPCKPTSRMAKVQLIKEGDESHHFESTFSPTDGYKIRLMELTDGGVFTCHATNDPDGEHDNHFSVHVDSATTYVNRPVISSKSDNFGIEHGELELNCSVEYNWNTKIQMKWTTPNGNQAKIEQRVEEVAPIVLKNEKGGGNLVTALGRLIVKNLDKSTDVGLYTCDVEDHSQNHNSASFRIITILGEHESFINITEPSGKYKLELSSSKPEAKWYVKYAGHPTPTLVWHDNRDMEIPWSPVEDSTRKLDAIKDGKSTTLKIRNPKIGDSGTYVLKANNGEKSAEKIFQLFVKEKPQLNMTGTRVMPNQKANLTCEVFGYPASTITWSFLPCDKLSFDKESCDLNKKVTFSDTIPEVTQKTAFNQISMISFLPESTGIVYCAAKNSEGRNEISDSVIVTDLEEDLFVWTTNELPISAGQSVSVMCGASAYKYATEVNWYKDTILVQKSPGVDVIPHDTPYSHRKELRWASVSNDSSGRYVCRANVIKDDTSEEKEWWLDIIQPQVPIVDESKENIKSGTLNRSLGEPLQLHCNFIGVPRPQIIWYKDNTEIVEDENSTRIGFRENNTILDIRFIKMEDQGKYECTATNRLGKSSLHTTLKISNAPYVNRGIIVGVIAVILFLTLCTLFLCFRILRQRKVLRELKSAGLANFEEGNVDSINPDLDLGEQADLLPYDKKYEFPREKLKLGKQLGAGAFGVVMKAYAQGILPYEEETTVAVKMVKQMADNEVMKALISELKIMVHLGQHLNVVNLLGAVTKNIVKREVMVIVEYCRFGNLQNFLVKHREYFVDQIVRDKDIIDPTIMTRDQRWSNDSGYEYYNRDPDRQSMGAVSHVNSTYMRHPSAHGDYFPGGMDSANTEATLISRKSHPGGEDNFVMSNNSTQPAWRSNYRMDYKGPARTVTTTDLLCWSFQVARGMQYLASRKVLHGDLAARNILLCDDNVVKICDFGLARSMYKSDNYRKKGETPLPFKWLALESLSDQMFSTYSDVWSFGIVLWELFSLGKVPYPGMDADQGLFFKLKDGYRMEKPDYSTQDIYDIMLSCWCANPESRPLFDSLEKSIARLLENGVAEHYIDLNEPYLQTNISNFTSNQTDYLALMAAPDCPPPAVPMIAPSPYVNSHIVAIPTTSKASSSQPSYLTMSPASINSPMPSGVDVHDSHFQFPTLNSPTTANNLNASSAASKLRNKIPDIPEEIPMLKRSNQSIHSDSDTELHSPGAVATHSTPNGTRKKSTNNVLNTAADNYVNVPSTIINMNNRKDAVSNPGYVVVSNVHETKT